MVYHNNNLNILNILFTKAYFHSVCKSLESHRIPQQCNISHLTERDLNEEKFKNTAMLEWLNETLDSLIYLYKPVEHNGRETNI